MKITLGGHVGSMRRLCCLEESEISSFPGTRADERHPAVLALEGAEQPGTTVAASRAHVLLVDAAGHITQVRDSVVVLLAVDVVELAIRPLAEDVQPSEAMRRMLWAIQADPPVAAV